MVMYRVSMSEQLPAAFLRLALGGLQLHDPPLQPPPPWVSRPPAPDKPADAADAATSSAPANLFTTVVRQTMPHGGLESFPMAA